MTAKRDDITRPRGEADADAPLTDEEFDRGYGAMLARRARAPAGLSQAAFVAQYGIPAASLRDWEQGRRSPTLRRRATCGSSPVCRKPSPRRCTTRLDTTNSCDCPPRRDRPSTSRRSCRSCARNRLDVSRVASYKLELALAQIEQRQPRTPVASIAATTHRLKFNQASRASRTLGRRKSPTFPRRLVPRHRPHARNDAVLVNVQAGDAIMHHVHHRLLSMAAGKASSIQILKSRLRSVAAPCTKRGHQSAPGPTRNRASKHQ